MAKATYANIDHSTPFMRSWNELLLNGWTIVPLPLGKKFTPPTNTTKMDSKPMTESEMMRCMSRARNIDGVRVPMGNVALVMPRDVIGIDVDCPTTYMQLAKVYGKLPLKIVLTSQTHVAKGFTAYFRVPAGITWKPGLSLGLPEENGKNGIDVIRRGHRYSVAPPSVHPSGRIYRWTDGANTYFDESFVPNINEVPELPEKWLKLLTRKVRTELTENEPQEVPEEAVKAERLGHEESCSTMNLIAQERAQGLKSRKFSRHDTMVHDVHAIVKAGAQGHRGAEEGLRAYRAQWLASFTSEERNGARGADLLGEWSRAVEGSKAKVAGTVAVPCKCRGAVRRTYAEPSVLVGKNKMFAY